MYKNRCEGGEGEEEAGKGEEGKGKGGEEEGEEGEGKDQNVFAKIPFSR